MALSSVLLEVSGHYSEAQLVVLVLAVFVVAVALLSYFVVAPEYEKRLEKQYAVAYAVHLDRDGVGSGSSSISSISKSAAAQRYLALTRKKLTKHRSLGRWDIEAASSDDDAYDHHLQRLLASESDDERHANNSSSSSGSSSSSTGGGSDDLHHVGAPDGAPLSMNAAQRQSLSDAQRALLARRRKSESDALKHANVNRAEMLRRRVLLKKLEEEIKGAMKEHDASSATSGASSAPTSLRGANDSLVLTPERLQLLQEHPADCARELSVLTTPDVTTTRPDELRAALQTLHDVLALYLSTDHRDMHKLTVFCNSLLQHDGLNHLRALELALDADVRALATAIIEMAVPSIWH